MQVRLLGPVDVVVDGAPRDVPGLRRKAVLAALALSHGEVLSTDRLLDIVWEPGAVTRLNTLQRHVSYLRRLLGGGAAIAAQSPGYRLTLAGDATDLMVAERMIGRGAKDTDLAAGAAAFRTALSLWRGQPLAGLADLSWFGEQAQRLDQLRLRAVEGLARARLELGQHAELLPELEPLAREYPFQERLHAQLMLALYRAGRQHDALAVYQRLAGLLDEELGISPSASVRELHTAILRRDPDLDPPAARIALPSPAQARPVPAQLPAPTRAFAGRADELSFLDGLLAGDPGAASPAVSCVVSGTAGVGKTALAVFWAHGAAGRFPDGQLYVNLRGFDPSGPAVDPAEAVRGFLDAFGLPAERTPAGLPAQAALYRSLLAGRRVLVVLDNARDAEQVRPLLPGSPGCLAIVTSRNPLNGLVAAEGAYPLPLGVCTAAEARDLLAGRLGAGRVDGEPGAVADIIVGCARLPLALAIAAARAAARSDFPLAVIAAELREASTALNALDGGDTVTDIRAVFSWSYRTLSTGAARLFRLLGLHPGPDVSAPAAASLAGLAPAEASGLLAELIRANLLTERVPGRFAFHDLLRAFSAEQAREQETEEARGEATGRMLDHYLRTAQIAASFMTSTSDPVTSTAPLPGVTCEEPVGYEQALAWFTAEHWVLLGAVRQDAAGFRGYAWRLASAIIGFLDLRAHWQDLKSVQATALTAARREGDQVGQATVLRGLGLAHAGLGEIDDARRYYLLALDLFSRIGDHTGQAKTCLSLASMAGAQGHDAEALGYSRQSLRHAQDAGELSWQAKALNNIGWHLVEQRDYAQALAHCQQALAIQEVLGDRNSQAHVNDSLGYIYRHLGLYQEAVKCYQRALPLFRDTGASDGEAICLSYLGDVYEVLGDADGARQAWEQALDILCQLEHPDADQVRVKLSRRGAEHGQAVR